MKFQLLLSGSALLLLHGTLFAAGMDCKRASTTSEQAICANPDLYRLDQRLGELYSSLAKG
ncbi:hypothetical protein ACX0MV_00995 [Pseudomonas borbori]